MCHRKEEQEENPTAVIHALEAYDKNLRSFKANKYIMDSTSSSTSSGTNDELGVSFDESQPLSLSSQTTDAIVEHSQLTNQLSTSSAANAAGVSTVSMSHISIISLLL